MTETLHIIGGGMAGSEAAWQAAAEFMQRIGLVDMLVPAAELFTNQFVES